MEVHPDLHAYLQAGEYAYHSAVVELHGAIVIVVGMVGVHLAADADANEGIDDEFVFRELAAQQDLQAVYVFIAGVGISGPVDGNVFVGIKNSFIEKDRFEVGAGSAGGRGFAGDEVPADTSAEAKSAAIHELPGAEIGFLLSEIYFFREHIIRIICVDTTYAQFEADLAGEFLFEVNIQLIDEGSWIDLDIGVSVETFIVLRVGMKERTTANQEE